MADLKTKRTDASVDDFLGGIMPERKRRDAYALRDLMRRVTGLDPNMWGPSIVGFGQYHYKYDSGHEGDFFLTGFSPRKQALTVYVMPGFGQYQSLLDKLGKHKTGRSCLYVNKLDDVDLTVLEDLIRRGFDHMREKYG